MGAAELNGLVSDKVARRDAVPERFEEGMRQAIQKAYLKQRDAIAAGIGKAAVETSNSMLEYWANSDALPRLIRTLFTENSEMVGRELMRQVKHIMHVDAEIEVSRELRDSAKVVS